MTQVTCPGCRKSTRFEGNEYRPFCSERCKLLDFGAWADGDYALPAELSSLSDEDIEAIERTQKEQRSQP